MHLGTGTEQAQEGIQNGYQMVTGSKNVKKAVRFCLKSLNLLWKSPGVDQSIKGIVNLQYNNGCCL